ncbi:MAG: ABC transporter permease [Planctomycetes bacterium]|nr:ABC transporter permease [Planctomycetota bacterium]
MPISGSSPVIKRAAWPATAWLAVFFVLPIALIAVISFARRTPAGLDYWPPALDAYRRALEGVILRGPVWNSAWLAAATTALCLAIGYPLALTIARARGAWRHALLFLVVLPFFTNFLVRTYAWFILLSPEAPLGRALRACGVETPLLGSAAGVLLGLVYGYLPFMVLPLYASLEKQDPALLDAAADLGASPWQAFRRVTLPLSRPGIAAGSLLVFVPVLGEFVVPRLLGGGKVPMLGTLIEDQFLGKVRPNWPFGAALAVLLMLAVGAALVPRLRGGKDAPWAA